MSRTRTIQLPQRAQALLRELLSFLEAQKFDEIWLVGGAVRDLLLGTRKLDDLDLAVPQSPVPAGIQYARKHHQGFVVLDQERAVLRLVQNDDEGVCTIDLNRFKEADIDGDLRARDFTINAMAIRLRSETLQQQLPVYDILDGLDHLERREMQVCADESFRHDPLRLLRAYRFAAKLGGSISASTKVQIQRDADLLADVSAERVRDELFKILAVPDSVRWVRELDQVGLLRHVLPELEPTRGVSQNEWHHLDVFEHSLASLETFEALLRDGLSFPGGTNLQTFLEEPTTGGRTYGQLYKMLCLIHDLAKVECRREQETGKVIFHGHETAGATIAEAIAERLKLSNHEKDVLARGVKNHMRPGVMAQQGLSERKLFRYFSETGREGVAIALFSLADRLAAQGSSQDADLAAFRAKIEEIIGEFYRQMEFRRPAPLISGGDLIRELNLTPGPLFREILEEIAEAQYLKRVMTREEALQLARDIVARGHDRGDDT